MAMDAIQNALVIVETLPYTISSVSRSTALIPIGTEDGTKRRQKYSINFMATIKED